MPKFSQNFLTSHSVVAKIVEACKKQKPEYVVEIGPGKGMLTAKLMEEYSGRLSLIEIDPLMVAHLTGRFGENPGFNIINADFMKADLNAVLPADKKILFVGNLPYASGTAILQKVLDCHKFSAAVFMLQYEVCQRILAKPGEKEYSVLSLSAQSRSDVKQVCFVNRKYFSPKPKVDSAVVQLLKKETPCFDNRESENLFFKIVKSAFMHRRKTVLNSLSHALGKSKDEVLALLNKAEVDANCRAENISLNQYLKLASLFKEPS